MSFFKDIKCIESSLFIVIREKTDYYPFGMPMPNRNVEGNYRYGYQGKYAEKEPELGNGQNSFELRLWDSRIGRWTSPDPKREFVSPYLGMGNRPTVAVDPDGGDIIIIGDTEAAVGHGHAAVLIGNEEKGWRYVSINGTGGGASPIGRNINPDLGENLIGKGLTETELIALVNDINKTEKHSYDKYIRITTSESEDKEAYKAAKESASVFGYAICGSSGNSCIDPPQAALNTVLDNRARIANRAGLFNKGMDDYNKRLVGMHLLVPNTFIDNLQSGIEQVNRNLFTSGFFGFFGKKKKGYIEVGDLIQLPVDPKDN